MSARSLIDPPPPPSPLRLPSDSTPEAIHNISRSVHIASRQALKPKSFSSLIPLRATSTGGSSIATVTSSLVHTPTSSVPYTPRVALSEVKVNDPLVATVTRKKKSVADKGSKRHTSAKTPGVSSLRGKGAQEEEEVLLYSPLVGSSGRKFQHGMHMPCPIDSISEAADKEGVVAAVDVMKNDRTTVLQPHDLLAEQVWSLI